MSRSAALPPHSGAALESGRGVGSVRIRVGSGVACRVALACGLALLPQAAGAACGDKALGSGTVSAVTDGGRTLRLSDGRNVTLGAVFLSNNALSGLETLLLGREVALFALGSAEEHDRYGRLVALVSLSGEAKSNSVQSTLLARGQAQVSGDSACSAALLGAERRARTAGLGLWADPAYSVRNSAKPAEILAVRGRFALVEGEVLSVGDSGGTIYLNFGRRYSEDFTVTIPKRQERIFAAAGLPLKKLAGQHVRVRGVVEERGGPWIEALAPGQIEIAD
jgi:endonuclease YncB( thermonuclease family)